MRKRIAIGITFAAAAAAAAIAGGVAYAGDDAAADPELRITYEQTSEGTTTAREDCPEKRGGSGSPSTPGETAQPEAAL